MAVAEYLLPQMKNRADKFLSAHIYALKAAPQTEENIKIRETIEKIFPEEITHVRWVDRFSSIIPAIIPR